MKLESFSQKFALLVDSPDSVEKIRQFVLELAVRGKLVPQASDDEPASELLKQIVAEKARRLQSTNSNGKAQSAEIGDVPFPIPHSWVWVGATFPAITLSDLGKKVQTKNVADKGLYPVVDQGKVFIRGYCNDSEKVIRVVDPIILFGDHTRETKFIDFDFVVGADGVKLLQPLGIDPQYYYLALRWLPLEDRGYSRHFKLLRAAFIPVPPLAEQRRIVKKVNELMALCDRLDAQLRERDNRHTVLAQASAARFVTAPTADNLKLLFHDSCPIRPRDLRRAILALAVRGDLGTGDARDETGTELLARIRAEKEQLNRNGALKAQMIKGRSLPTQLKHPWPDNWAMTTLGEIAQKITDGTHKTPKYLESGIPFVSVKDFSGGQLSLSHTRFISFEEHAALYKRCDPRRGDVLIGRIGTLGKAVVVDVDDQFSLFVSVGLIRCSHSFVVPSFLQMVLNSPYVVAQFDQIKIGGATHTNKLNLSDLYGITIGLPPLAEQTRIVSRVNALTALTDQLGARLVDSDAIAERLASAMIAELTAAA